LAGGIVYRWLGSISAALLAFLGLLGEQTAPVAVVSGPAISFVESTDDDDAPTARLTAPSPPAGGAAPPVPPRLPEPLHLRGDAPDIRQALTQVLLAQRPLVAATAAAGADTGARNSSPPMILTPLRC
jgi:hypothetical protein